MYSLQKSSRLCQLPDELILTLRDHLDPFPAARACLALTCHYLLGIIGVKSLQVFNERHGEIRQEFLTKLLLPGYYYCHTYSILRPFSKSLVAWEDEQLQKRDRLFKNPWFQDKRFPERWLSCYHPHRVRELHLYEGVLFCSEWGTRYQFKYLHLQLAMRRHLLGPEYGIVLDNLSLIEVLEPPKDSEVTVLSFFEARIGRHYDNGEQQEYLYSRIQNCIYLDGYSTELYSYLSHTLNYLCRHMAEFLIFRPTKGEIQVHDMIANIFQTKLDTNEYRQKRYIPYPVNVQGGTYPSESKCYECPYCDVNVQICIKRPALASIGSKTLAIFITRWYRLGQGKSPREITWMCHMCQPTVSDKKGYYPGDGVVRQEFEKAPGLSQAELTARNCDLVLSKQYRNWKNHE